MSPLLVLQTEVEQKSILTTVYESILDGGWMMVPIGLCSIVAFTFFLERLLALRRGHLIPRHFQKQLEDSLHDSPKKALEFCHTVKAPIARIMEAGLRRWGKPVLEVEKAVEDAGSREMTRLSGNLRPLVVVSTISPLLGLLGTVIGMIKAFQVIAVEKGIGKPELLAEGISQALVTTAAGLIVAIPAQVAYYYLRARIDRFARQMEHLYYEYIGRALDERKAA